MRPISGVLESVTIVYLLVMLLSTTSTVHSLQVAITKGIKYSFKTTHTSPTLFTRRYLNRIFFDPAEVVKDDKTGIMSVQLSSNDFRFQHITQILKLGEGDTLRGGILDHGLVDDCILHYHNNEDNSEDYTDKKPKVEANKTSAVITLGEEHVLKTVTRCKVDLLLAVPRPLRLEKLLPVISSLGVDRLALLGASRVQKDYFGSHLFRRPQAMRTLLVEGLMQANCDYHVPQLLVEKDLDRFLTYSKLLKSLDQLEKDSDEVTVIKIIAHPPDPELSPTAINSLTSFTNIVLHIIDNINNSRLKEVRIVIAVGPEGGWLPEEVQRFVERGFCLYELGPRVLRTDTAVAALLSQAHEILRTVSRRQ